MGVQDRVAADAAAMGIDDALDKGARDGGIDRVATRLQHLRPFLDRDRLGSHDHVDMEPLSPPSVLIGISYIFPGHCHAEGRQRVQDADRVPVMREDLRQPFVAVRDLSVPAPRSSTPFLRIQSFIISRVMLPG